jgi:hypothetical protein
MGAGRNGTGAQSSFGFRERVSETDTRKERPLEGGEPIERSERGGRLDGEMSSCTALQGAAQGHGL